MYDNFLQFLTCHGYYLSWMMDLTKEFYVLWLCIAYCVVAVEAVGRQIPMAFLERIKEDFSKRYGGGKATNAKPNSLNKEFGYFSSTIRIKHKNFLSSLGGYDINFFAFPIGLN